MKPTERITSLILVLVLCLSIAVLFAACRKAPEEIPETSVTETTKRKKPKPTTEIHIEEPTEAPTQKETTTKTQLTTKAPSTTRTPSTTKAPSTTRQPSTTRPPVTTKAPTTTQPTTQKPKPTEPTTEKPVTTTKQDVTKAYVCGNSRHHCKTAEDHAFIKQRAVRPADRTAAKAFTVPINGATLCTTRRSVRSTASRMIRWSTAAPAATRSGLATAAPVSALQSIRSVRSATRK